MIVHVDGATPFKISQGAVVYLEPEDQIDLRVAIRPDGPPNAEQLLGYFACINRDAQANNEGFVPLTDVEYYAQQIENIFGGEVQPGAFDSLKLAREMAQLAGFVGGEVHVLLNRHGDGHVVAVVTDRDSARLWKSEDSPYRQIVTTKVVNKFDERG